MKCTRSNRGDHLFLKEDSDGSAVIGAVAVRLEVIAVVGFVLFLGIRRVLHGAASGGRHNEWRTPGRGRPRCGGAGWERCPDEPLQPGQRG